MSSEAIEFPLKGSICPKKCQKGISYRAVIDLPSNKGNRRQKKKSFPDWKFENPIEEAKAWLVQKNPKYSKEDYLENLEIGFIEYLKSWHKEKIGEIRGKTRQKREWALYKHVFPGFSGRKLSEVSSFEIDGLYQAKLEELSPSSVRIIDDVLSNAFNEAVERGLIDEDPTNAVAPLPNPKKEFQVFDHGQIQTFLKALKQFEDQSNRAYPHYPLFYTAINTGLRPGELLGMRLCDLNLDDGHIRVRKSLKNDDGLYLGELKTDSSYRAVKLTRETKFVLEEFLEYREKAKERADDWGGAETVFCTQKGNLTWPSTPRRKLNRVLETTDLPHITMHEFRHTHATMLIRAGVSIYNVSRRLGHSSVKTTERRYLDYVPSMQQETVDTYQTSMDF